MNTELGVKLEEAIVTKNNNINNLVWKGRNGEDIRLMDMSQSDLKSCYRHCTQMLYNPDLYHPGEKFYKIIAVH